MSIEKNIERIADALEIMAGAIEKETNPPLEIDDKGGVQPQKKTEVKKTSTKKTPPAIKYTEDDLRQTFQEYVGRKGNEEGTSDLKKLIKKHGADKIGEIKPENFTEIIEEVKSWE